MSFFDRVWMSVASTGTGPVSLGSPVVGFRSFAAAGVPDGATVSYTIVDGTHWETGHGVYGATGNVLSRGPLATSAGNANAIAMSAAATVFLDVLAADLAAMNGQFSAPVTAFSGLSVVGPAPIPNGGTTIGTLSYEYPTTRLYMGDGTGYSFALSCRSIGGVTTDRLFVSDSGNVGVGTTTPVAKLHVNSPNFNNTFSVTGNNNGGAGYGVLSSGVPFFGAYGATGLLFGNAINGAPVEFARFDASANLLVGVTSGASHRIAKTGAQGTLVATIDNGSYASAAFYTVYSTGTGSSSNAAMKAGFDTGTNRSINAGGTINASGADYAEYMVKSDGCPTIAKGDVCGVDADGKLTTSWAAAHSFVVKSTDPNLVGGDTWSAHLGDRPTEPALMLPPYAGPPLPSPPRSPEDPTNPATASAYAAAIAAYETDLAAYQAALAAHEAVVVQAQADHDASHAAYVVALEAFEQALEVARWTVDRIAFCGQAPVNLSGAFAPGDYVVAVQNGDAIQAIAVAADTITFNQYRQRIGKIWAVRDGRAWIDVQHG